MNYLWAAIVFIIGECICIFVFNYIKKALDPGKERSFVGLSKSRFSSAVSSLSGRPD